MAKVDGVEYPDDKEVDAYWGKDGFLHIVESLEELQEEEERSM